MNIVTEDRTPSMEAQFPASPEATEGQSELARCLAAFDRQGDNMAFVLNHAELHYWFVQFERELEEDRATISAFRARSAHADIEAKTAELEQEIFRLEGQLVDAQRIEAGAPAGDAVANLTRPIIGIENRTALEAFDIMADRIRSALAHPSPPIDGLVERLTGTDSTKECRSLTSFDRLRLYAHDPDTFEFDSDNASDVVAAIDETIAGLTQLREQRAALETERDAYLEELGKVIMACPMRPDMRMSPASQGVRNLRTAFEAAEGLVERLQQRLDVALGQARYIAKSNAVNFDRMKAADGLVERLTAELTELRDELTDSRNAEYAMAHALAASEAAVLALTNAVMAFGSSRMRDRIAARVKCESADILHDALQIEVRAALQAQPTAPGAKP